MTKSLMGFAVVLMMGTFAACGGDDGGKDKGGTSSPSTASAGCTSGSCQCGNEKCELPEELEGEEQCCMDPFAGGCGIKSAGSCRAYPKTDSRCPPPDIMISLPNGLVGRIFGCCTGANECGVDFGMGGCQPRTVGCRALPKDQVDMLMPQTCDGEELPLPENCGNDNGINLPGFAGSSG